MTPHPPHPSAAGFFAYHGIWAPGVRSFRNMTFAGKSSLIAFAFLVPVIVLAALFVPDTVGTIRKTALERDSLAYANDAVLLLRRAQEYRGQALREATRQSGGDTQGARAALDAQFALLDRRDLEDGAKLATSASLAKAHEKLAALAAPGDGLLKVYATNAKFIESIYALIATAADGGGLTLDPDLDASSLMHVGVLRMPRIIDEAARMTGLSAAVATAGQGGDIAGVELNRLDTLVEERSRDVALFMAKAHALDTGSPGADDLGPAIKMIDALRDESTDAPGSGGAAKAARLSDIESRTLTTAWEQQGRVMTALEGLLASRQQRLVRSLSVVGAAVLVSLLLASYMLYSFFLVMNGGLVETRRHLDRMAEGDLTSSPSPWGSDDAADLMGSLLRMQAALRQIVSGVRGTADEIASSTVHIGQGVGDMSARSEHTAASLQQTSSSMLEISGTVTETADVVQEAAAVSQQSAAAAGEGELIVERMVAKMTAIHLSSKRIADIIGVIDGIAFQTNILALNAAVEAARAGDQGRGFAVVAGEVRSLAQRSSVAAREIKELIGNSVENVEAGTAVVRSAGETMTRIVSNAGRVRALLDTIAEGAKRQRLRVVEVSDIVREIDDSSQQTAALSEEAVAATGQLSEQTTELLTRVARFRLPGVEG